MRILLKYVKTKYRELISNIFYEFKGEIEYK